MKHTDPQISQDMENAIRSELARISNVENRSAGQYLFDMAGSAVTAYGAPLANAATSAIYSAAWGTLLGAAPVAGPLYFMVYAPGRQLTEYVTTAGVERASQWLGYSSASRSNEAGSSAPAPIEKRIAPLKLSHRHKAINLQTSTDLPPEKPHRPRSRSI